MKKTFKYITFSILFITCLFLFTGCVKINIKNTSNFEIKQVDEKSFTVNLEKTSKGTKKTGTVEVKEGGSIVIDYKLEDLNSVMIHFYLIENGNKKDYGYSAILGEGHESTDDLPEGKYELSIAPESKTVSGTINVYAK